MSKKTIVAGHICVDITPTFPHRQEGEKKRIGEILIPGKLLHVGEADVHVGGSVSNTGLAMKLLGCDVTLLGKVGSDAFGHIIYDSLNEYNAGDGLIVSDAVSTSYTVVLAVPGTDRIFLHNPGANDTFCASDIPEDILKEATLFHFGYPPLMKSMYENEGEELLLMFQKARSAGTVTSLDLASVDPLSDAGKVNWRKILEKVLPFVDIFVPSAEELCYMLDKELFTSWQERAGAEDVTEILDIQEDIEPLASQCLAMGAKIVLIKCGVPGLYCATAGEAILSGISTGLGVDVKAWAGQKRFEKSYRPDRVLSGTGCGDTSIAAFLCAILKGYGPEQALHLAAATGACCVSAYDALSALKPFDKLEERISAGWEKVQ